MRLGWSPCGGVEKRYEAAVDYPPFQTNVEIRDRSTLCRGGGSPKSALYELRKAMECKA